MSRDLADGIHGGGKGWIREEPRQNSSIWSQVLRERE